MGKQKTIRVGGVPEHFNLPWHLAIEKKRFAKENIHLAWKDFPGGTGAMTRALRHRKLDVAVLLTEGIVTDIANRNKSEIVQFYVSSPLTWGVFVNADSPFHKLEDSVKKRFAISRIGSGSHLMARVFAREHNYELHEEHPFRVVSDLNGAVKTMRQDKELLFLWEEFTTKHLVTSGEFRMIDKLETPWPCFVIAARKEFIEKHPKRMATMLSIINDECRLFMENREQTITQVMERFGLNQEDATIWFDRTKWHAQPSVELPPLEKVMRYLTELKIVKPGFDVQDFCTKLS